MTHSQPTPHILCIDDNPDVCVLLSLILQSQGFRATTAGEVSDAMEILQQQSVDLLIADKWLTDGCGDELCRAARRLQPHVRIVITSHLEVTDPNFAKCALADACLSKPFEFEDLVQTVRTLLDSNDKRLYVSET